MHSYELTERGKIIVAVILVFLFFVLPAVFLAVKAWVQPAEPPGQQDGNASGVKPPAIVETVPPEISKSPPPNGGGFNPPDVFTPETSSGNGREPEEQDARPPGQPSVDPAEGRLSFYFSPDTQTTLGVEIIPMLTTFLDSPKNTPDSLIAVELPPLPAGDMDKIIDAVINAFAALGVEAQRLQFITRPAELPDAGSWFAASAGSGTDTPGSEENKTGVYYEIKLYFYEKNDK